MASDDIKYKVTLTSDDSETEKEGKKAAKSFRKGVGNNGYIKLKADIDYNYPKQTKSKSGIKTGVDYSGLQKAQDKLISDWKKLSKEGFYSDDDKLFNLLKSWRDYQKAVDRQYRDKNGNLDYNKEKQDERVSTIRATIGKQIERYLTDMFGSKIPLGKRK